MIEIISMGAGDVTGVGPELLAALQDKEKEHALMAARHASELELMRFDDDFEGTIR